MYNYFNIIALSTMIFVVVMSSCSSDDKISEPVQNDWREIELDAETRAASESLKDFYMQFTTDAVKYAVSKYGNDSQNVIVSPLSASMVLAMVANGVDGETQKAITDYLGTSDIESLNNLSSILLKELPKADNQSELKISNSAWTKEGYKFSENYKNVLKNSFLAETGSFTSKNIVNKLNNWCSKHTNGLISDMFDDLDTSWIAILINALYYKGLWEDEFEFLPGNTKTDTFKGILGDRKVEMMHSLAKDRLYYADENFESFALYFGNTSFSLRIILPSESLSLEEADKLLADDNLERFIKESVSVDLDVYIPKFNVKYKTDLNEIFAAAGLDVLNKGCQLNMFDPTTDGIINFNQAASFGIDEEGVKAAAVSSANVDLTAPMPGQPYTVKVDRPFYFFLRDKSTGACLLSGRIAEL